MSDTRETCATSDVVVAAERYRDRLIAELEKVDVFLRTAGELSGDEANSTVELWTFESAEAPRTLH